jgi:hypothetical protein
MDCFPSNVTLQPPGAKPDTVLVDATPDYLFNSIAAPRIKSIVPQARFVIILRVRARSFSSWLLQIAVGVCRQFQWHMVCWRPKNRLQEHAGPYCPCILCVAYDEEDSMSRRHRAVFHAHVR